MLSKTWNDTRRAHAFFLFILAAMACIVLALSGCASNPPKLAEYPNAADIMAPVRGESAKDQLAFAQRQMAKLAGTVGELSKQVQQDEVEKQATIARWCSASAVLGLVAAAVLLYLGSRTFAGIAAVASVSVFVLCQLYAAAIVWCGAWMGWMLGAGVIAFLGWEAWANRAALFHAVNASPPRNVLAPVRRRIDAAMNKIAQRSADAIKASMT